MDRKESSLDICALLSRYAPILEGAFIKKVYHIPPNLFTLQLNRPGSGRIDLFLSLEKGIYVSTKEGEVQPTQTAINLRKLILERKIQKVEQVNFDRVVRIDIYPDTSLIIELFREGNLIVTVGEKIELAVHQREWKNRKIIKGERYLPPSSFDPVRADLKEIEAIFAASTGTVVQTLASRMNLGGDLAEELCFRAGMDKSIPAREALSAIPVLMTELAKLLGEASLGKCYVYENGGMISPIRQHHLDAVNFREAEDFNEELRKRMDELVDENPEDVSLRKRIESQQRTIAEYEAKSADLAAIGTIIMSALPELERHIRTAKAIDSGKSSATLPPGIILDRGRKIIQVPHGEMVIDLDIRKTAGENANSYFQESKDYRHRVENAREALKESINSSRKEESAKITRKRKFWFEKYRWTFTSEGNLVIAGKDRKTNESAVKKHLESTDIYVHADLYGAPSTVIKSIDGKRPDQKSIEESCAFAVSFSRAWSAGISSGSAYWVFPEQVSKTPESGEYVSTGSWIIRGKRNYIFNLPLVLYIAPIEYEGEVLAMASPVEENQKFIKKSVRIVPGKNSRRDVVKRIAETFNVQPDEVDSIFPPGSSIIS